MKGFCGFPAGKVRFTSIPNLFFSELLPLIDDLAELKVTLHIFWLVGRKKGDLRCASRRELMGDGVLLGGLRAPGRDPAEALSEGLERAVARGTLLRVAIQRDGQSDEWYFLNTDKGRRTVERIRRGEFEPDLIPAPDEVHLVAERPNIFVLYEQNIGLLQPMIAEELKEAERTYPPEWIEEAFKIAAEQNVRRWRYVKSILERWATEGKDDGKRGRDYGEDGRRYLEGKYSDYIEH